MALGDYKVGDSGQGVSDLQGYLNEVGYDVAVDGVYGAETRNAVIAFQRARGIRSDGIAGPQTLVELSRAKAEGWTAPATGGTVVGPTATTMPAMNISPIPSQGGAGGGSSMTGLLILVALAVGVWLFTSKKEK